MLLFFQTKQNDYLTLGKGRIKYWRQHCCLKGLSYWASKNNFQFCLWYRLKENLRPPFNLEFSSQSKMFNPKIAIQSNDQALRDLLAKGRNGYLFFPIKAKWFSNFEGLSSLQKDQGLHSLNSRLRRSHLLKWDHI